jgi:hypothetical protein
MAGNRIDDIGDAKRLASEYDGKHRADGSAGVGHASLGPAPAYGVTGMGMPGGVEADLNELRVAEQELARLQEGLLEHLRAANALTEPMRDGTGPVTTHMRKAFLDRADLDGGVQAALTDYMEELLIVRGNILDAVAAYQGVDEDAVAQLNRQATELDREAPSA